MRERSSTEGRKGWRKVNRKFRGRREKSFGELYVQRDGRSLDERLVFPLVSTISNKRDFKSDKLRGKDGGKLLLREVILARTRCFIERSISSKDHSRNNSNFNFFLWTAGTHVETREQQY